MALTTTHCSQFSGLSPEDEANNNELFDTAVNHFQVPENQPCPTKDLNACMEMAKANAAKFLNQPQSRGVYTGSKTVNTVNGGAYTVNTWSTYPYYPYTNNAGTVSGCGMYGCITGGGAAGPYRAGGAVAFTNTSGQTYALAGGCSLLAATCVIGGASPYNGGYLVCTAGYCQVVQTY